MAAAVWSFLEFWWTRLFARGERSRAEESVPESPLEVARTSETEVTVADGEMSPGAEPRVPTIAAPSREAVRLALAETLKDAALGPVAPEMPALDAATIRERTLASLGDLRQIPALQSFAQNFLRTLGQIDVDVADVVEVVSKDSALCVRILRMANSVMVSSERRIEDLDTAVQMLGLARVRKTAQTLFTLRDGNRVTDGFDWRHLWMHAIATASIADELERQLRDHQPAALHVAALLHDVGKIVLSTIAPEDYRAILVATWHEHGRLEELERSRLGVDHREAGVLFARQCGLPEMVIQAIAHHDRPEAAESFPFEVALISLANYVSKAHGLGFSGARLDASDGEFVQLPAWRVIEAELGFVPDIEGVEYQVTKYAATVRAELREMREGA